MLILLVTLSISVHAQQDLSGTTASGANYRIRVPAGWQAGGALVLYQHGFDFSEVEDSPGLGPLLDVMLAEGYAVAASSYSQRGWAVFTAVADNRELVQVFGARVGVPGEVIPWGGSLGGLIALKIAEAPDFPPIRGVYSICPAAAGSRLWDQALDLRLAYDVVCANAGDLPTGEPPLAWAFDLDDIPDDLDDLGDQARLLEILLPLNQCTGINLPPALRSSDKQRRLDELMRVAGTTDEDFFVTNIGYATYALGELVRAPDKLGARNPLTTVGVDYGDAAIDAGIQRLAADPIAALQLRWYSDFRGDTGAAKIVSLHTSRDELVIPANQDVLRRRVAANRLTSAIVDENEVTHCGFTEAEGRAGWEALREWIDNDLAQPAVADLQQRCTALTLNGVDGPCRFDAAAVVPSIDSKIKPRPPSTAPAIDAHYTGQWFDPSRSGEGVMLEVLADQRALVTFFTYPPIGETGAQAWMSGVGTIVGNGIAIDTLRRPQMQRDPVTSAEVLVQPVWGTLWLSFDDCANGHLRWQGPPAWGQRDVPLQRLTALEGLGCGQTATVNAQASGSWFDPRVYGSGFAVERLDANRTAISWFSPGDSAGGQLWTGGVLEGDLASGVPEQTLYQAIGTHFGDDFDPADVQRIPAMQLRMQLGCGVSGTAAYVSTPAFPGSGLALALQRITRPLDVPDCAQ